MEETVKRHRGRLVAVLAGAVALALVITGGAFAASRRWSHSSGKLPEAVVPASTGAFVRLNLAPGLSQQLKFAELLKKFPKAPGGTNMTNLLDGADLGLSGDDVRGWIEDRAGVGIWTDGAQQPVVLVAVAASDDGKARTKLTKARERAGTEHFGFVVADGYALIASADKASQAAADAAARQAKQSSLAASPAFRTAVAALPADQALLGFADLAKLGAFAKRYTDSLLDEPKNNDDGFVMLPGVPSASPPDPAKLKGTLVVGAQAVDNGIELRSRITGIDPPPAGTVDVRPLLDALPGNSVAAGAVSGLGDEVKQLALLTGVVGLVGFPKVQPIDPKDLDKLLKELPEGGGQVEWTIYPGDDTAGLGNSMGAIPNALGTAKAVGVAISGTADSQPQLRCDLHLADEAAAKKLMADAASLNGNLTGTRLQQQGSLVRVEVNGYRAADGALADSALFKEAMAGTPATPAVAGYVDVTKALAAGNVSEQTKQRWAPVRAIGLAASREGADAVVLVRIVIK